MSGWERTCRVQKVIQQDPLGCGVACASMASGKSYAYVRQLFVENGIGARKQRPLSTGFRELQRALKLLGVEAAVVPWRGWDAVDGIGIVAVDTNEGPSQNWHWIVAERHDTFGVVIHDPDFDLPAFSASAPTGVLSHPFTEYSARKSWLRISSSPILGTIAR